MVMSVLEARVAPEGWEALRKSYSSRTVELPPGIVESFLVQNATDSAIWRIVTVWRSQDALEAMRRSGTTPTGVLIFRDAGAEPVLTIYSVWANPRASASESR